MDRTNKNNLFIQGSILACAGIITKVIGFLYRIPMNNMLGEQGNGIYSVAFGIYSIALTLSSYSLPFAVSKLVSARLAKNEYMNSYRVFIDALLFTLIIGLCAFLVLYIGADGLERLYDREGLAKPLRVLAPTTFVIAALGAFRGYFQGKNDMIPTAISQIIEQIINAVVSILATYYFMKVYMNSDQVSAYGAAGGTVGTLAGAVVALLFLVVMFVYFRPSIMEQNRQDKNHIESNKHIYKILLLTIIPVILSQTIYQIGYTIDDLIFGNVMGMKGYKDAVVSSLQGVFNTQYNPLINLPVAVAAAMAVAAIPSIVFSSIQNRTSEVIDKTRAVIKLNMVIAFPSAIGLSVLSKPIIMLLFPKLVTYQVLAINLLLTGSSAVIFYSLSTITTAILQVNNYMRVPMINSGISLAIHVVLVYALLTFTNLHVYALIIGNVTFSLIVCILNCRSVSNHLQYKWEYRKTFVVPFVSSMLMGIVTYGSYKIFLFLLHSNGISLIISIILSIIVYFALILKLKCFLKQELLDLPMGDKIIKFAKIK